MTDEPPILATLTALPGRVRITARGWHNTNCPNTERHPNGDKHPSFGWRQMADGNIVVKCMSGCTAEEIATALGHQMRDLFVPANGTDQRDYYGQRVYVYADAAGKQHLKTRLDFRNADGTAGKDTLWEAGAEASKVLWYHHEALLDPTKADGVVYITEGESDCDALTGVLHDTDWVVIAAPAASYDPPQEAIDALVGRTVVLWPDLDQPGHDLMTRIATRLTGIDVAGLYWVNPPDRATLPDGAGAADWVASLQTAGKEVEEPLVPLGAMTVLDDPGPRRRPGLLVEFGTFIERVRNDPEPPFVIEDFMPYNGLVIVGGQPKTMKSLGIVQMGVAASVRVPFLDRPANSTPAFVYITEEGTRTMHADRLEKHLDAYPEARGRCHIVYRQQVRLAVLDDLTRDVHDQIEEYGSAVAAIDPLRDYMPSGKSEKDDDAIATVKAYLRDWLTAEPNLTIGLVHHVIKDDHARQGDGRALSGSGAIYAMADATVMWYAKKIALDGNEDEEEVDDEPLIVVGGISGHCIVESRSRPQVRIDWVYDAATGLIVPGTVADASMDDRVFAVLDGHDINNEGLYKAVGANSRKDKAAVRAALSRLSKRKGLIVLTPDGFWTRDVHQGVHHLVSGEGAPEGAPERTNTLFEAHQDMHHGAPGSSEG